MTTTTLHASWSGESEGLRDSHADGGKRVKGSQG